MLTLILKNFRCYNNLTLQIPLGQTTLIKGSSGSGKTTLFKAITWALYGVSKKKLITPFTAASNAKTTVVLQFNHYKVTRCLPKKLEVIIQDQKYVDVEAQQHINQIFGHYDVWLSTSYVAQKKDNYFLSASNADKINILNLIAFRESNPMDFIEKINKYLEQTKTIQQYKLTQYNKHMKQFKNDDYVILSNDEEKQFKNNLSTLQTQLCQLNELKRQHDIDVAIKKNKKDELTTTLKKLQALPHLHHTKNFILSSTMNQQDLMMLQDTLTNLININNKIMLKKQLEEKLKQFGEIDTTLNYTVNDLQDIIQRETLYQQNDCILKKYELDHDQEEIKDYIKYCQDLLNDQKVYDCQEKLQDYHHTKQNLLKFLDDLNDQLKSSQHYIKSVDMSLYDNTHCHNKIMELSLANQNLQQKLVEAKNHITCPHCHQEVMIKNGVLIKVSHIDDNIELIEKQIYKNIQEMNSLQNKMKSLKEDEIKTKKEWDKQQQLVNQLSFTKQQKELELSTIEKQIKEKENLLQLLPPLSDDKKLTVQERENIYKCIHELKTVTIVFPPSVSSHIIKDFFYYQEIKNKYNQLLETIPSDVKEPTTNDIEELKDYVTQCQRYLSEKTILDYQIQQLTEQMDKIIILPDPSEDIKNVTDKIKHIQSVLEQNKEAQEKLKEKNKLNEEREEVCQLSQRVDDSTELKQRAVSIECQILDNIVKQINTNVDDVCSQLFDQDIKIELSLFKTLKVSSKVKQAVTFNMFYKNGVYDNIEESGSGGEAARISISLTLALNRLFNHKLILFDETTESLDIELKNRVIQCMTEHGGTCIIIQHEGIEGVFDHVIDVDQFK
jgi:DNA repair exonuclease SbcCD ATPase subunit